MLDADDRAGQPLADRSVHALDDGTTATRNATETMMPAA